MEVYETMLITKVNGYILSESDTDVEILKHMNTRHLHTETKDMGSDCEDVLNNKNCDLALCERYFKSNPIIPTDRELPKSGERYRHFKTGKIIMVIGVSQDTENVGSYSVVYLCKDKDNMDKMWNRPLDMFLSRVDAEKYPEHAGKWRFERLDDD